MDPDKFRIARPYFSALDANGKIFWFRVELNAHVFDEIERSGGHVTFEPGHYKYPRIEWWSRPAKYLHRFVYEFAHPCLRIPKGHIIHHANEDKFDATIENLVLVDRRAHAKFHLRQRKVRKFSPHPKEPSERRPPSRTVPVSATPEQLRMLAVDRSSERSRPFARTHGQIVYELMKAAEANLASMLANLRLATPWLYVDGNLRVETGRDPRWDSGKTWRLGLKKPRLQLTQGEEAFVLLMVANSYRQASVAEKAGMPKEVISRLRERPAVAHALDQLARSGLTRFMRSNG